MKKNRAIILGLTGVILLTATVSGLAKKKLTAEKILEKVHQRVETIRTLVADFEETFHWVMIDEKQTFSGKLYIGEGDKFRLQTAEQVIVSDGKTLWTYDAGKKQVLIDNVNQSGDDLLPRRLLLKFQKNYHARLLKEETIDGKPCYVLELISKSEDVFIPKMTVWIDKKTWLTKKLRYEDVNQNVTTYRLRKIKINQKIPEDIFHYKIPPNIQVIDMRAE
ncbi:MAG: outer membrane lipoprotein carrier protein LolA [Calditrichaeota bacterium]|nr:outer membrane lipoprotein carrier protein LolA [Calditrichota bacterium]